MNSVYNVMNLKTNLYILSGKVRVIHVTFIFLKVGQHFHVSDPLGFGPRVFSPILMSSKKELVVRRHLEK